MHHCMYQTGHSFQEAKRITSTLDAFKKPGQVPIIKIVSAMILMWSFNLYMLSSTQMNKKTPQWYGQLQSWSSLSPSQTFYSNGQRPTLQPPQPDPPPQHHTAPNDTRLDLQSETYIGGNSYICRFNIKTQGYISSIWQGHLTLFVSPVSMCIIAQWKRKSIISL